MNKKEKVEVLYSFDERTGEAIIRAERVIVHYKCVECGATEEIPLKEGVYLAFLCGECSETGNYMEIIGVSILEEQPREAQDAIWNKVQHLW